MNNIINNKLFLMIVSLISIIIIFVMKFILISSCGFLELFLMLFCLVILIISIKKINNKLLKIILVLIIIWFSLLAIDYKRHRNMYQPLFAIQNENRDFIGIGYKIVKEYNQEGDYVYQSNDKFYLFGILIDEVKAITDINKD